MGRCLCLQNSGTCLGFSLDLTHVMLFFLARLPATVFLVRVVSTLATFAAHPRQDGRAGSSRLPSKPLFFLSSHYGMSLVTNKVR